LDQTYLPKAAHISRPNRDAICRESGSHKVADSAWKTAYSTARVAISIAKESSDMFLLLKAVVGALSILIENYDVSPILVLTTKLSC